MLDFARAILDMRRRHDAPTFVKPVLRTFGDLLVHFGAELLRRMEPVISEQTDAVSAFNLAQIDTVWQKVLRVPYTDKPAIAKALETHRARNVGLIKTLSQRSMGSIKSVLDANPGASADDLVERIGEVVSTSESHARLIARDQTLKLNGNLTMERHTAVGVTRYEWVTSNDDRVRPYHARLNDTEHDWTDPPVVSKDGRHEHPGGDYQCRCIANPVIDLDKIT